MEAVLVSAATGALKPVLEKLAALLGDEYKRFKGVRGEIRSLTRELATMDAFLMKMSEEEDPDVQDKVWMNEVRELSYDLEDCIDDLMQSIENPEGFIEKIKHSLQKLGKMKARRRISNEIKDLKNQITEVGEKNARYRTEVGKRNPRHDTVQAFPGTINGTVDTRALVIFDHVSNIVGIDESKAEIINLLTREEGFGLIEPPKIVSIVGPGGMGKTTLANQVYKQLRRGFNHVAFLSVSRSPNMINILRTILSKVSNEPYAGTEEGSVQQLAISIFEFLQNKRYLIVVDDIWDINTWDVIKCAFPKTSAHRSKIITTTRIKSVAEACSATFKGHIYDIRPLDIGLSRQLFYGRIFDSEHCPSHLEEISNQILRKCDGLPLAIIAISSLLASKPKTTHIWNEVKDSIGRALERNRSVEIMMKILSLSYFDLPSLMKTCLLYLGIFPEDTIIKKKCLIRKWISEGFFHKQSRYTVYELGEICFNELVNRSLVQLVIDKHHKMNACRVHDTVLDFIISKSIEDNFVTLVGVPNVQINGERKVRRLSLQVGKEGNSVVPTRDMVLSHARSINYFGKRGEIPQLDKFRHLRVLDFGGSGSLYRGNLGVRDHNIKNIGALLHLRYLNLSGTEITEIPPNIGCLRCLELLDLRGTSVHVLPESIVNLPRLVHLLTHGGVKFPDGVEKLKALEVLKWIDLSRQKFNLLQPIGQLRNLRQLFVDCESEHCFSGLVCLNNLRYLKIRNGARALPLGSLCPVPLSIHKFVLQYTVLLKVPEWMLSLVNLQELRVELERIGQDDLCVLGSLPALLKLKLEAAYNQSQDTIITVSGEVGFPYLTDFQYGLTSQLRRLKFAAGSMPNLKVLTIALTGETGYRTETLTDDFYFGIKNLPRLATVDCIILHANCSSIRAGMMSAASAHPNRPTVRIQRHLW